MARPCLQNHPKFRRLVHTLKVPVPHAVGYLECLWIVAYECGDPFIGDATDVELAAQWPGETGQLCDALLKCGGQGRSGFIEQADDRDGFQVHDLFDHAPDYVRRRGQHEDERKKEKACEHCGTAFRSPKGWAKYCGDACKSAAHRAARDTHDTHGMSNDADHDTDRHASVTDRYSTPAPAPSINTGSSLREKPKRACSPEKFQKPTIDEIRVYCTERKNSVDPDRWLSHYQANGWRVGKNPMRDWKAAVRTWERNGIETNGHTNGTPTATKPKKQHILTPEEVRGVNEGRFDPQTGEWRDDQ